MPLFTKQGPLDRLLGTIGDPQGEIKSNLPGPGKALKVGLIAAAGLAGLTAASAGISSLRRRAEAENES